MGILKCITQTLLIIGGLNWGLIAAAEFDFVAGIFGAGSNIARVVYGAVGISALFQLCTWCGCFGSCKAR